MQHATSYVKSTDLKENDFYKKVEKSFAQLNTRLERKESLLKELISQ